MVQEQAALKVAVGAWSAVVGQMALRAGLLADSSVGSAGDAPQQVACMVGFILWSGMFGASQEALTRFADRKAQAVQPGSS